VHGARGTGHGAREGFTHELAGRNTLRAQGHMRCIWKFECAAGKSAQNIHRLLEMKQLIRRAESLGFRDIVFLIITLKVATLS